MLQSITGLIFCWRQQGPCIKILGVTAKQHQIFHMVMCKWMASLKKMLNLMRIPYNPDKISQSHVIRIMRTLLYLHGNGATMSYLYHLLSEKGSFHGPHRTNLQQKGPRGHRIINRIPPTRQMILWTSAIQTLLNYNCQLMCNHDLTTTAIIHTHYYRVDPTVAANFQIGSSSWSLRSLSEEFLSLSASPITSIIAPFFFSL